MGSINLAAMSFNANKRKLSDGLLKPNMTKSSMLVGRFGKTNDPQQQSQENKPRTFGLKARPSSTQQATFLPPAGWGKDDLDDLVDDDVRSTRSSRSSQSQSQSQSLSKSKTTAQGEKSTSEIEQRVPFYSTFTAPNKTKTGISALRVPLQTIPSENLVIAYQKSTRAINLDKENVQDKPQQPLRNSGAALASRKTGAALGYKPQLETITSEPEDTEDAFAAFSSEDEPKPRRGTKKRVSSSRKDIGIATSKSTSERVLGRPATSTTSTSEQRFRYSSSDTSSDDGQHFRVRKQQKTQPSSDSEPSDQHSEESIIIIQEPGQQSQLPVPQPSTTKAMPTEAKSMARKVPLQLRAPAKRVSDTATDDIFAMTSNDESWDERTGGSRGRGTHPGKRAAGSSETIKRKPQGPQKQARTTDAPVLASAKDEAEAKAKVKAKAKARGKASRHADSDEESWDEEHAIDKATLRFPGKHWQRDQVESGTVRTGPGMMFIPLSKSAKRSADELVSLGTDSGDSGDIILAPTVTVSGLQITERKRQRHVAD